MAMNRQRRTSNISNIFSYDDAGNIVIKDYSQVIRYSWNGTIHGFIGPVSVSSVAAATTDTDKFLVSDGGVLKFRTGTEVLSDIGGQPLLTNPVTGTGVAGQVAYWSGTNSQTGSNNLFWDAANNRLGIRSSSPTANFEVKTSDDLGTIRLYNADGNSAPMQLYRGNNGNVPINTFVNNGTISAPTDVSVSGAITRITGNIYLDGAYRNVARMEYITTSIPAIGNPPTAIRWLTTNASYSLDERAGITSNGNFQIGSTITTNRNSRLYVQSSGNTAATYTAQFHNSGLNNALVIDDAGSVMLGSSTSSGQRLQVQGTALITGNTEISAGNLSIFTTNTPRRLNLQVANGSKAAAIGIEAGGTIHSVIGADTSGTDFLQVASRAGIAFYSGSTIGNIVTDPTNERMRLTTLGLLGLGTTSPSYKLDVQGTSGTVAIRALSNTAGDILYYATGTVTGSIDAFRTAINATGNVAAFLANSNSVTGNSVLDISVPSASTGDPYLSFTTSGATNWSIGIDNSDGDKLKIGPVDNPSNSSTAIVAHTTGNISLNSSTDAGFKLDVNGTARVSGSLQVNSKIGINSLALGSLLFDAFTASAGTIATLQSNGAAADNILLNVITGNSVTGALTVFKGSSTTTGALDNLLQQNGNGSARFQSLVLGTGDAYSLYNINGGQAWSVGLDNSDSDKFKISGASELGTSDYLTITTAGSVGIGTTTPATNLHVSTAGSVSGRFSNTTSGVNTEIGVISGLGYVGTQSAANFIIITSDTERARFTTGGNLLVGTTADQGYRVQITGSGDNMLNVWGATTPSIRLDNAASGATQRFVIGLATATNNFIQGANAGDVCLTTASSSAMVFGMWQTSSSSEIMRISTSNNLLVGTSTDVGAKLRVVGDISGSLDLRLTRTGTSPAIVLDQTQLRLVDQTAGFTIGLNVENGILRIGGAIRTNPPAGSGNPEYKLGSYSATAPTATGYLNIEVGGVVYKVLAST